MTGAKRFRSQGGPEMTTVPDPNREPTGRAHPILRPTATAGLGPKKRGIVCP